LPLINLFYRAAILRSPDAIGTKEGVSYPVILEAISNSAGCSGSIKTGFSPKADGNSRKGNCEESLHFCPDD